MVTTNSIPSEGDTSAGTSVDELTQRNVQTIEKIERAAEQQRAFGERVADSIAGLVGSWPFIIFQTAILIVWIILNIVAVVKHWDPYPFILLNLALSFQAAYTGPIVMMSQNRQAKLAERRNRLDLQINLLSEQENTEMLTLLKLLCEKNGIHIGSDSNVHSLAQEMQPEVVYDQLTSETDNVAVDDE